MVISVVSANDTYDHLDIECEAVECLKCGALQAFFWVGLLDARLPPGLCRLVAGQPMEIKRGDATVHHERLLHGSGGNTSADSWRRAWVVAFRSDETVAEERRRGFTHSHNDDLKVLNEVGKE